MIIPRIVRIGELAISKRGGDTLVTHSLGSCVAIMIHDDAFGTIGMAHIVLPKSAGEEAKTKPEAYFADLAVKRLLSMMQATLRCKRLAITLAGGAQLGTTGFKIGKRNLLAVRREMMQRGVAPRGEDVGGSVPRTVHFNPNTGEVKISYPDRESLVL